MRLHKRFLGAAVLLAVSASLTAGAGAAQAAETTLCKTADGTFTCPSAQRYSAPTVFKGTTTTSGAFAVSATVSISCTNAAIEFENQAVVGMPLSTSVKSMTASGCTTAGGVTACSASAWITLPFSMGINWTMEESGLGKITDSPNPQFKYTCGTTSCAFQATEIPLEIRGGEPATAFFSSLFEYVGGSGTGACGKVAKITDTYKFTAPNSGKFYVEHI